MVFRGPHLPFAFLSNSRLPSILFPARSERGAANKMEGKQKGPPSLVPLPQAAAGYSTNSSFCWRATFRDESDVWNVLSNSSETKLYGRPFCTADKSLGKWPSDANH